MQTDIDNRIISDLCGDVNLGGNKMKKKKYENYVKNEMIDFVKRIKKEKEDQMDKHICDHLLYVIDDYYILEKAVLRTSFGRVVKKVFKEKNILVND